MLHEDLDGQCLDQITVMVREVGEGFQLWEKNGIRNSYRNSYKIVILMWMGTREGKVVRGSVGWGMFSFEV